MNLSLAFALMLAASPVMAQEGYWISSPCAMVVSDSAGTSSIAYTSSSVPVYVGSAGNVTTNDAIQAASNARQMKEIDAQRNRYEHETLLALYRCEASGKSREKCQ